MSNREIHQKKGNKGMQVENEAVKVIGSAVFIVDDDEGMVTHEENGELKFDWPSYRTFIDAIRVQVRSDYCCKGIPILRPFAPKPQGFFDCKLCANNRSTVVRIKLEDLYVIGFKRCDTWFELRSDTARKIEPQKIPGSISLGICEDYGSLEEVAEQRRRDVVLGQQQLIDAVFSLAESTDLRKIARGLLVIIQMIAESARFVSITTHIANSAFTGIKPPLWMLYLEHSWGRVSGELQMCNIDHTRKFRTFPECRIVSIEDAVNALGLLLHSNIPEK